MRDEIRDCLLFRGRIRASFEVKKCHARALVGRGIGVDDGKSPEVTWLMGTFRKTS